MREFIKEQRPVVYEDSVEGLAQPPTEGGGDHRLGDDDELLEQAAELVVGRSSGRPRCSSASSRSASPAPSG